MKKPEILSIKNVGEGNLFKIEQIDLLFSNGEKRTFERCRGRLAAQGAVLIIPFLDENNLLLVKEYAAGIEQYEITFPKGLIDNGEKIEEAVQRELREEGGYGAKRIEFLKTLSLAPNYLASRIHLVAAYDLFPDPLSGDEPEPLQSIAWPINQLNDLAVREDFSGAANLAALYYIESFIYGE